MTEKKKQGFATMDVEDRRTIASMGGRAAHRKGTSYEWTSQEAQIAGRKGGLQAAINKRARAAAAATV